MLQAELEEAGVSTRFNEVPPDAAPLRRLEAALFMIGYDLGDSALFVSADHARVLDTLKEITEGRCCAQL